MLRAFTLALGLALCTVIVACGDDGESVLSNPEELTGAGKGDCPEEIEDLIDVLFSGGLNNAVTEQCNNVERQVSGGETEDAIAKVFALIGKILTHDENGQTHEPPGAQTKDEALAELLNALLALVGGGDFFTDEELADPNFGFGICFTTSDCTIVNGTGLAGIHVFAGSTTETKLIKFSQLPLGSQPSDDFNWFDFIYDFEALGASDLLGPPVDALALAQNGEEVLYDPPAIVGVCVADAPFPGAPTGDELEFLQLARFDEENEEVELLPIENADFLSDEDCEEASQVALRGLPYRALAAFEPISDFLVSPLFASPGRLGGAIAAHSPVGAVDNRGVEDDLIPTTTALELENSQSCCGFVTSAQANVSEDIVDGGPVFPGDVEFVIDEIEGDNDFSPVRALDDGGAADLDIVCDGETGEGQIGLPLGSYTIQANFLGTETHEASSSEPQDFDCVLG